MPQPFVITKDPRGPQMHVRRRDDVACVGCIEVGLFAIVQAVIEEEAAASAGEGTPTEAAREAMVAR